MFCPWSAESATSDWRQLAHSGAGLLRRVPAFPVDTHIHRLAQRWGLTSGSSVEQTEADLKAIFEEEHWNRLHLQVRITRHALPLLMHGACYVTRLSCMYPGTSKYSCACDFSWVCEPMFDGSVTPKNRCRCLNIYRSYYGLCQGCATRCLQQCWLCRQARTSLVRYFHEITVGIQGRVMVCMHVHHGPCIPMLVANPDRS
jgi:hypothetical protein